MAIEKLKNTSVYVVFTAITVTAFRHVTSVKRWSWRTRLRQKYPKIQENHGKNVENLEPQQLELLDNSNPKQVPFPFFNSTSDNSVSETVFRVFSLRVVGISIILCSEIIMQCCRVCKHKKLIEADTVKLMLHLGKTFRRQ